MSSGENGEVTLDGNTIKLPYTDDTGSVRIKEVASVFKFVETNYDIGISFASDGRLYLTLGPSWLGKVDTRYLQYKVKT